MAAFTNQQQPFVLDSSFMFNNTASNMKNITSDVSHFTSEPHHTGHEPFITNEQYSDKTSAVMEELQNGDDQDSRKVVISMEKNKKGRRRASPSSTTRSKDPSAIQRKIDKKPKKSNGAVHGDEKKSHEEPPKGYIHVRARRGEATDSHSLAERVRREKISERMRLLQRLVPGCDKTTGKAPMLDQIISYVQSLQNQVEFLSLKVASLDPTLFDFTFDVNTFMAGDDENNKLDSFASQVPTFMQPCSSSQPPGSIDAPTAASLANKISFMFHPVNDDDQYYCNLLSNPQSVFLQGQSSNVFAQDCASLYMDMENPSQEILSSCDFSATYVPSID